MSDGSVGTWWRAVASNAPQVAFAAFPEFKLPRIPAVGGVSGRAPRELSASEALEQQSSSGF
jgi:hypothetical protein